MLRTTLVPGLALTVGLFIQGCSPAPGGKELADSDAKTTKPVEGHAHEHGPHDGEVIELGANHGELVLGEGRLVTLYILDGELKNPVPLADTSAVLVVKNGAEPVSLTLKAKPQDGETDGKTSRFESTEPLPESARNLHALKGDVVVTTAGQATTATLGEHGHQH